MPAKRPDTPPNTPPRPDEWRGQFAFGLEQECQTNVAGKAGSLDIALRRFMEELAKAAPTLPGESGCFHPYGRTYVDTGPHLELASLECDSPYQLALLVERGDRLAAKVIDRLEAMGLPLRLANNNYSGLLNREAATWGSHESYLIEEHPSELTQRILPFVVTRILAGAGAVHHPSGDFLAAARPQFMRRAVGGSTTRDRAIHSTCRQEHHQGMHPERYRYHGILGDGHRSQFNLALQFGATALALKAMIYEPDLVRRASELLDVRGDEAWVERLLHFHRLAAPGEAPRVDPLAIEVQRIYLDAATRFAEKLESRPQWIDRCLKDWGDTLDAFERGDREWLAARLDAFAKYELFSSFLAADGHAWSDLAAHPSLFNELVLLDHSYHAICHGDSVFHTLEREGLLAHRVGEAIEPGGEPEPFVPETGTRARARARFLVEHGGTSLKLIMNWSHVYDLDGDRLSELNDPFAREYEPWRSPQEPRRRTEGEPQPAG